VRAIDCIANTTNLAGNRARRNPGNWRRRVEGWLAVC
jgi:hypothetical protein